MTAKTSKRREEGEMRTIIQALLAEANASEELHPGDSDIAVMREAAQTIKRHARALKAAAYALRSYQAGNSSPDLAEEVAEICICELGLMGEEFP